VCGVGCPVAGQSIWCRSTQAVMPWMSEEYTDGEELYAVHWGRFIQLSEALTVKCVNWPVCTCWVSLNMAHLSTWEHCVFPLESVVGCLKDEAGPQVVLSFPQWFDTWLHDKMGIQSVKSVPHTHNSLMALCPGLPRWAGTRRDLHALTPMRKKKKDLHRSIAWELIPFMDLQCFEPARVVRPPPFLCWMPFLLQPS